MISAQNDSIADERRLAAAPAERRRKARADLVFAEIEREEAARLVRERGKRKTARLSTVKKVLSVPCVREADAWLAEAQRLAREGVEQPFPTRFANPGAGR